MLYKLEGLQRVYGDRVVLDIDFLEIAPGVIYTLIGPNGAGKTSLLKILAFLDKPSSGDLSFSGHPVSFSEKNLHTLRRRVVMLDQTPILFTGTVWKNVEFGLKVRKVPAIERKRRVEKMLELVGMEKFREFDSRGLSGGEVKRVALARALVLRPDVLLCDEPTANVDGENQESILNTLEQINREEKRSIIFSTHYLSQGQRLADHTLLLQQGSLSNLAGENIFRAALIPQIDDKTLCRLTGQISLLLPAERVPSGDDNAKLHIDPKSIVLDPEDKNLTQGNYLYGKIMDMARDRAGVRIGVDAGVRLVLNLSVEEYDRRQPALGQRKLIFIPWDGVVCTSVDFF